MGDWLGCCVCVCVLGLCSMIKVEGSLGWCVCDFAYVCVCVLELWCYRRRTRCSLRKLTQVVCFLGETFIYFSPASLWMCRAHLCSVSVCVHPGGKPRYDKGEKQTSTSEPSRAPGGESGRERRRSITPISLLHLDMPPRCFARSHLVVFPPSAFLFLPSPHFCPRCEPHRIHRRLFI